MQTDSLLLLYKFERKKFKDSIIKNYHILNKFYSHLYYSSFPVKN